MESIGYKSEEVWVPIAEHIRNKVRHSGPGSRLPSIRQLMREFAVSQSTIQLALEGLSNEGLVVSRVGKGTFVSDPAGTKRKKSIMVLHGDYPSRRGDEITRAIQVELSDSGYRGLVLTYTDMEHALEVITSVPPSDGYILQPNINCVPISLLHFIQQRTKAVVVNGTGLDGVAIDGVGVNPIQSVELGLRHLYELGHRRIAVVGGEPLVGDTEWVNYFRLASRWANISQDPDPVLLTNTQPGESAQKRTREWMLQYISDAGRSFPFTAMIARSYATGIGLMEALNEHSLRVPEDVSVVVIDNPDLKTSNWHDLTMVGVSSRDIGLSLLRRLEWRWENPEKPYQTSLVEPALIQRASVRRLCEEGK